MCTSAGEWEGRTDYTDCIAAGQQEMVCITEMDASDISLYIYLVGEDASCHSHAMAMPHFYDENEKPLEFFAVQSSISVYLGFRFSLPSAIIFPFLPHSSKIHPPTQLLPFLSGAYGVPTNNNVAKNE